MTLKKFVETVWGMVYDEENGNSVHPCEYLSTKEIEDFAKENNLNLDVERYADEDYEEDEDDL